MPDDTALERIRAGRIIAILRGDFQGLELEIAAVLVQAKITAIEVTLNSANALATIERLATGLGDKVAIGAGTVLRVDEMQRAGARRSAFYYLAEPGRHSDRSDEASRFIFNTGLLHPIRNL